VLADSPVVVHVPWGRLLVFSDNRLDHLPGRRPYRRELVRTTRNQPGGFWVASTVPQAAYEAVSGSMPFTGDMEVGLFTDGVSRLVEFYGYDWERVFAVMKASGPAGLISVVRSAKEGNPPGHGKEHDDATAVLMTGERAG
jgi:hypothetical protein